ncbi:MAG: hypothetical protein IPM50_02695 [Acidobacteriota bacterium]|nr:MAG: hypothetical protein IPM50_02695 [Acidobacteriota bacterium]
MSLQRLTKQIFDRFDKRIVEATNGTVIPPSFVAGLIANESGRDRQGSIVEAATRFEPHVYRHLINVRDGRRSSYNKLTRADLAGASDAAIRALATSWGITQIMGWHVVRNLRCTVADLRDPAKHLFYTVKLLQLNGFPAGANEDRMDREMREWNTGSETGKTYHANYVPNARTVRSLYRQLEKTRVSRVVGERVSLDDIASVSTDDAGHEVDVSAVFAGLTDDEIILDLPQMQEVCSPDDLVLGGHVSNEFVPEDKVVDAPPKEDSTKKATTVTVLGFAVPTFLVAIVTAIRDAVREGFVDARDIGNAVVGFISANQRYVFYGLALVVVGMMLKKLYKQVTLWLSMWIAARPDLHNVNVRPQ